MMSFSKCLALSVVFLFSAVVARPLQAAPVTFTSLSAGDWATAGTWNAVPPGDHAFPIDGDTAIVNHGVTLAGNQATNVLTLQNFATLGLGVHTLVVDAASDWSSGSISGGTLDQRGTLTLTSGNAKTLTQSTLNNSGTLSLTLLGNLQLTPGATLLNGSAVGSTAIFDITSDADVTPVGGGLGNAPLINNSGTVRKSAGGGVTTISTDITNRNGGLIEALTGTLQLSGTTLTNTGGTVLANGGNVQLAGGINVIGGTLNRTGTSLFDLSNISVTFTGPTNAGYMRIAPNTGATVSGTFLNNNGTLEVGASANAAPTLQNATDFTFSGTGDLLLSDSNASLSSLGASQITNAAGHLIHGRGTISANLNNAGNVLSDVSSLVLSASGKTNTGTMSAANGTTLVVNNVPINNAGGIIRAEDGGAVQVNNPSANILGGTLQTAGAGVILFQNSQFADITNQGLLRIGPNTGATVSGSGIVNSGRIELGASVNATPTLNFATDVTLGGTGDIFLSDSNCQLNTSAGVSLTVPATQDIHGRGSINAALISAGTIRPELGTLTLAAEPKTNTGTIKAEGGLTLVVNNIPINNAGGIIRAEDASVVQVNNAAANILGGTLQTVGSGVILFQNSQFADIANQGLLRVAPNTGTTVSGSGIVNSGRIELGASVNATPTLTFATDVTLSGTGDIFLSDSNTFLSTAGSARLTVPATQDIHGRGTITAALDNAGIIRAETGQLILNSNLKNNTGTIAAESSQTLRIDTTINNQGGLIVARDTSTVLMNGGGALVQGGTLDTEGSGVVQGANSNLADVTNQGLLRVQPNTTVDVTGSTLTNNGTIDVGASVNANATLQFSTDVALAGTGDIFLSDSNAFLSTAGPARLTVPATQNIHGRGNIQATLDNAGIIRAETGLLVLNTNAKNNTGTIAAESAQTLRIDTAINNQGGLIVARIGSLVQLNGGAAFVQNGTLDTEGSGLVQGANCNIADVTNQGLLRVQPNTTINVTGTTLTNNGTIDVGASANANATLQFSTDVALAGTGDIFLSDSNAFLSTAGPARLTIPATQNIHGRGNVQATLDNAGIIRAETGQLVLHTNAKNNTGTIAAESGQTLRIDTTINNAGGLIVARDTSLVQLNGGAAFVQGGTLDTEGSGLVQGANCNIADVTNQGLLRVQPSTTINVGGTTLTNNGTIDIGASANASGTLQFVSGVVAGGSGEFLLSDSNAFLSSVQGALPVFGPSLLIHGRANLTTSGLNLGTIVGDHPGQILIINPSVSPGLFNGGHIHVSGPQNMTINTATNFTNMGDVEVDAGRTLVVTGGPYRTVGGNTKVAGTLQAASGVSLLGGILSGAGTVTGNVNNDGGTVAPGTSAGTLSVTGAYTQSAAGELQVEIGGVNAGEFDKLAMTGTADLCGGTLVIDVINGFIPTPGQTFIVLTAPTLQGAFDSVVQDCSSGTLFTVTINANNVTLTAVAGSCGNRIVSSIAPNGSVDARRATNPNGTGSFGPTSIALTFASAPGALTPADFAVSSSNGTAPTINTVNVAGNVATVTFSGIIPQNSWTTVRHLASNTASTIGFRPGDVNADGSTNTVDPAILSLGLGGHLTPALSQRSCDINRSTACTSEDMVELMNLLNGADGFSPQLGVTHPTCNIP